MRRNKSGESERTESVDCRLTYETELGGVDVEITVKSDDILEAVDFMNTLVDELEDDQEPPERFGPGTSYEGP